LENKESLLMDALKREVGKTRKALAAARTKQARISVLHSAVSKIKKHKYVTRHKELLGSLERDLKTLADQINGETLRVAEEPGISRQADGTHASRWRAASSASIPVGPPAAPLQRRRP
jgi:hypothetical protein